MQRCPNLTRLMKWRKYATLSDIGGRPKSVGDLNGFILQRTKHIPELQLTAYLLHHEKTGAEYLHVARDDKNNVFSIGFKTNPPDDTGVPHILEHTTLCGSERYLIYDLLEEITTEKKSRYPVRDPFFKMLPRSLSNFMNAFTSSDHTTYPFATTNRTDFSNLMSVYLDATLHPLLHENDFKQEGWRIGPENPLGMAENAGDDAGGKLVFKGVVYNEMKGQMSDASYLYYIKFQDHIFPAIHNSGGDPQQMTNLTYKNLKDYHARNYHPSNAKLFTYGDMPLVDHLCEIGYQLNRFEKMDLENTIKTPIKITHGPLSFTVKGPVDPLVDRDMQHRTSTSWLMGETGNILESFSLGLISSLLLHGYGSPFHRNLIETGLGPDWSPNTGYDASGKIGIFSIGLSGVREVDVPKVKDVVHSTLLEVRRNGFDKGKVDGILHQLELGRKHKTANFGIGLMQRLQSGWFNGVDPFDALAWDETVKSFKHNFAEGGYLESLLDKYLLNDNTLTLTMQPSETYGDDLVSEEAARLSLCISKVSNQAGGESEGRKQLTTSELELLEAQNSASNQDVRCLPTLQTNDIPRKLECKDTRNTMSGHVNVQWREANTNGLTYFRALNLLHGLPRELRELIPLFSDTLLRLGTKEKTIEEIEDLIKLKTGGINLSYHVSTSPTSLERFSEGLLFSGHALDSNVPAMYDLFRMILLETDFDGAEAENKIKQLLEADANGALDAVASSGHSYARRYAEAGLTRQGLLNEQTGGLTQVQHIAALARRSPSEGLADVVLKLKSIQKFAITNSANLRTALTCGKEAVSSNESALYHFLSFIHREAPIPNEKLTSPLDSYNPKTQFPLPYQVFYSAMALSTVPYVHSDSAPLQILSQLLTHKYLHHEIREKGGAYGGGAYARGLGGIFGFYSYRDPNPKNSIAIMRDAGRWARDKDWCDRDLEEAKLSVFQGIDAPQSVNEEGMTKFLTGVNEEMEQKKREELLDVRIDDVRNVAQRYLVDGIDLANIAVLGGKKDWAEEHEGYATNNLKILDVSETMREVN